MHLQSEKQKSRVYFAIRGIALLWLFFHGYFSNCSVSGFVYCIYNTEFMALAVGTMNLPWLSWNSCCASGCRLGSQHRCFSTANRDDSFYEEILM